MAAKILANLIVMGSSILARAFVQAYRQALATCTPIWFIHQAACTTYKHWGYVILLTGGGVDRLTLSDFSWDLKLRFPEFLCVNYLVIPLQTRNVLY
ncbi:hypothetical protein A4A49_24672 [Nicotiana attenuata]|uniref:Uncharacterized protein n=1 Tax=Nicotiana attenuata TaxID=49451 RepID=A0A314KRF4_NICAT|nr:hypothetical protein A4A49_24672 [Nicotiana attenuata]